MPSAFNPSRRALLAAAALAPLAGCTRLGALNGLDRLTPGAGLAVTRVAEAIAYGPSARQMLDVYAPEEPGPRPVLLFFYGGSWQSGRRQDYAFAARALAGLGYVVVVPDYRLAPAHAYPDFLRDAAAATAWTSRHIAAHGGDPARLAVIGHSAGAYIALMLALDPRWLGPAFASTNPLRAAISLAGPTDFLPFAPAGAADIAFGHIRNPSETQPITHARTRYPGWTTPAILLLHGETDDTVLPRNATNLALAGTPATLKLYPDLGHIGILLALSRPFRPKAPVLNDTAAFLSEKI
ncbi:alpha/beta hydrolase [Polymorphobacter sp.]|uniref:alpha/beta hydrolase n=1 Tax=Polymorphobacter sp. TaxID=1909290 RepID=UPI003F6F1015